MNTSSIHLYLWYLTGRAHDFQSPCLNTSVTYPTAGASADVVLARQLLGLDRKDSDYAVLGCMAALYCSLPALRTLPPEQSIMFLPRMLPIPGLSVQGASFRMASGSRWPNLRYHPTGLPEATKWKVAAEGPMVRLSNDAGLSVLLSPRRSGNTLLIDLAPYLSADTEVAFEPLAPWTAGSSFTFSVPPSRFPYAAVAETIRTSTAAIRLMSNNGTMEAFASALDPLYKVGALLCAMVLSVHRASAIAGVPVQGEITGVPPAKPLTFEELIGGIILLDGRPLALDDGVLQLDEDV